MIRIVVLPTLKRWGGQLARPNLEFREGVVAPGRCITLHRKDGSTATESPRCVVCADCATHYFFVRDTQPSIAQNLMYWGACDKHNEVVRAWFVECVCRVLRRLSGHIEENVRDGKFFVDQQTVSPEHFEIWLATFFENPPILPGSF